MEQVVVLAADNQFLRQLETTIKSLCCHNRQLTLYIFNRDIPNEWFHGMNRLLAGVQSRVIDTKITTKVLDDFPVWTHINYATYMRYFIPQMIEADRVVYLDADIIVSGSIEELFRLDLADYPLAAVAYHVPHMMGQFNAGMLVVNNRLWRQENMTEHLLYVPSQLSASDYNADEEVLNRVFKDRWLPLHRTYNYLIGYDSSSAMSQEEHENIGEWLPKIVHYITSDKPWEYTSYGRLRELWWYYYQLSWTEIPYLAPSDYYSLVARTKYHVLTLTESDRLDYLEDLVVPLPSVHFHIAAYTQVSQYLRSFDKYPNVTLYPGCRQVTLRHLISKADCYLDINYGDEVSNIVHRLSKQGFPVLAFANTAHQPLPSENICEDAQAMIERLNQVLDMGR